MLAERQNYRQLAAQLGVRNESSFHWFAGQSQLQVYAAWHHALTNGNLDLQAAFAAAPGSVFAVKGIGLARDTAWSGIGISTAINRRMSWFANYDAQLGRGGLLNNVALVGIRIKLD